MPKQKHAIIYLNDIELLVEYTYYPPRRGARDSFMGRSGAGPALEPDEPESIEISKITVLKDTDIFELLSDKQLEKVEDLVLEEGKGHQDEY